MKTNSFIVVELALLVPLVIVSSLEPFRCGPDNRCTCVSTLSSVTMDCSGRQFRDICGICNFSSMYNVTSLDASHNNIGDIEGGTCVSGCGGLKYLDLHDNNIANIKETVFETIHGLMYLDLSFNNLDVYSGTDSGMFKNQKHLQTLFLNGNLVDQNAVTFLYPDLSNLTSLVNLSMDGLLESQFGPSFSKLTNLTGVFMSGQSGTCNLGQLHNDTFQHLRHLETLRLSHCNISNIDLLTLSVLPKLRWLDLSYNQRLGFETLHNVSYGLQFTDIKFLNYSYVYNTFGLGTVIQKHHVCYLWNTTLQEFAIDNNRIEEFETNAPMLIPRSLQTLHVNYNKLLFGNYALQVGCLESLTTYYGSYLRYDVNPFPLYFKEPIYLPNKDVYKNSMDCPFMEYSFLQNKSNTKCPYIDENKTPKLRIPIVPVTLKNVSLSDSKLNFAVRTPISLNSDIKFVNASGNFLSPWIGPTRGFNAIKVLDLSRNGCSNISGQFFGNFRHLNNLQLGQNFIGVIPQNLESAFQNLTSLKILSLSDNRISTVPPRALHGLSRLETLDLSVNLLREWTIEVNTLGKLTNLVLRNNLLEGLPESLTSHLVTVSARLKTSFTLDLLDNHLKCTCKYQTFLKWTIEHKDNLIGFGEIQFYDENDVKIESSEIESELKKLGTKCRSNTLWIVLSTIGASLSLSLVVGSLVYRNRWKLRYFLYMSKQRFYGYVRVLNEDPIENYKYDAFISYAEENLRFVKDQLIPMIEQNGVSLCVHQRDFLPGNAVADNIVDAIQSSRKTVVLLTKAFLKRKWCMYEFNMARMENIYSRDDGGCLVVAMLEEVPAKDIPLKMFRDDRGCLVVVMLEEVPAKDMPLEMLRFIQTESYIEYTTEPEGQVVFWDQLKTTITT